MAHIDGTNLENSMILFLDFDGVAHPQPCFDANLFCRLHLIEAVLRERALLDVGIVISSSWRENHTLKEMHAFFSQDMQGRVIGCTLDLTKLTSDWLPGQAQEFARERECQAWMQTNCPLGTPWLAVDDRADWFRPDCANLLVIDGRYGFHPDNAAALRHMLLRGQRRGDLV
jgi:hypothetical protein